MQLSHFEAFFLDLLTCVTQGLVQIAVHFYKVVAVFIERYAILAGFKLMIVEINLQEIGHLFHLVFLSLVERKILEFRLLKLQKVLQELVVN